MKLKCHFLKTCRIGGCLNKVMLFVDLSITYSIIETRCKVIENDLANRCKVIENDLANRYSHRK